ncbi:MAG: RNA methyltransferase [Actinomycetota bacterium]
MTASFTSPRVHALRRLLGRRRDRHDAGRFVVEGPVLVAEAVRAGWSCVEQFVPADCADAAITGAGEVVEVAPDVLGRLGSTQAPQPPVAVVEIPAVETVAVLGDAGFVVVVDRLADPGNLGTILRSVEAAGADAVVLTPGSVDPYNPKVVRASAGALFHVPVVDADLDTVAAAGLDLVGTSSHDRQDRSVTSYTEADLCGRIALVMGNEAAGLPDEWTANVGPIGRWVTIPHRGRTESLNVAMATTVLAFEAARQRAG